MIPFLLIFSLFTTTPEQKVITPPIAIAASPLSEEDATSTIINAAHRYGIDAVKFLTVAKCEDPGLIPDQQSNYVKNGKREESYGIFQINVESNNVSIASATDPAFAADWAAKEWSEGLEHHWSCFNELY